jgi:hypothetical protein
VRQVVDVVRGASRDGKLNSWITVQYDCQESAEKGAQVGRAGPAVGAAAGSSTCRTREAVKGRHFAYILPMRL